MKTAYRRVVLAVLLLLLLALLAWRFNTHDLQSVRNETSQADNCTHKADLRGTRAAENPASEAPAVDPDPAKQAPPVNIPAPIPAPQPQPAPETEPALEGPEPKDGEKFVLGRVVDGESGEGVAGASVWAANMREILPAVTTNAKGRFRLTGLPQTNKVKLLAKREGFLSPLDFVDAEIAFGLKPLPKHNPGETGTEPRTVFFDARDIKFTWADLSANPVEAVIRIYRGVRVEGRCQDEAGHPIKGAFVSAKLLDFGGHVEVRSGPRGEFSLGSFPGGRRTLEISASNAGKEWGYCTILELGYPTQPWEVVITLRAKASICCRFVPLDSASKSKYLVQINTESSTFPGSSVNSPAWECGFNGFVEIGQRFMVVVVEMRDPKLGMGPVVAQSDWNTAQQETVVVVNEQLRTRVEASLEGMGLDWSDVHDVTLTSGPPGSVSGCVGSFRVPGYGQARTTVRCSSLTTETSQDTFVVACRVNMKPESGRGPLVFVSDTMNAARGQTLLATLRPVSEICGDLSVRVTNRNYGCAIVEPICGGSTIMMKLLPDGEAGSAPFKGLVAGVYRVWWIPSDNWKSATRWEWAKECVVVAGGSGRVEITVPK
ncbi:MAG: carboxypeptidase regulatory-like domain-containing protein [Planctomycetes bacterium]|nr:carboxypeptidase regulatory-like domain-containing protein [Planctomycetota bacterium]